MGRFNQDGSVFSLTARDVTATQRHRGGDGVGSPGSRGDSKLPVVNSTGRQLTFPASPRRLCVSSAPGCCSQMRRTLTYGSPRFYICAPTSRVCQNRASSNRCENVLKTRLSTLSWRGQFCAFNKKQKKKVEKHQYASATGTISANR